MLSNGRKRKSSTELEKKSLMSCFQNGAKPVVAEEPGDVDSSGVESLAASGSNGDGWATPVPKVPSSWDGSAPNDAVTPKSDSKLGLPAELHAGALPPCGDDFEQPGAIQSPADKLAAFFAEVSASKVSEDDWSALEMIIKKALTGSENGAAGEESVDSKFSAVATTGVFEMRGGVGQHFQRSHAKGQPLYTGYHGMATREAKRLYREEWAKKEYAKYLVGKDHEKSYQVIDRDLGEMMTFGSLVVHYGGWAWQPAVAGAKRTVGKCAKLGGKWMDVDPFSELNRFLVLTKKHEEVFAEKWKEFEREISDTTDRCAAPAVAPQAGVAAVLGLADEAAVGGKSGGKGARRKATVKPESNTPKQSNEDAESLKRALQVKAQLTKHKVAAEALVQAVMSGRAEYAWANNPACVGMLQSALSALEENIGTLGTFGREFMIHEPKVMKDSTGTKWLSGLEGFINLQPAVAAVHKQTMRLIQMHCKSN